MIQQFRLIRADIANRHHLTGVVATEVLAIDTVTTGAIVFVNRRALAGEIFVDIERIGRRSEIAQPIGDSF